MRSLVITTLVQMLTDKELVLPAMQRPFVWSEERILRLIDSLLRRFPLGTVLVWSTDKAQRFRAFSKDVESDAQPVFTYEQAEARSRLLYVLGWATAADEPLCGTKGNPGRQEAVR